MKIKTSYPVIVNGINQTPNLYYDASGENEDFYDAIGSRKRRRKPMTKRKPMGNPMAKRKPLIPVNTSGTRIVTLGSGNKFDKMLDKSLDRPQFYNADGNMNIFTTYPVVIDKKRISPNDYFLNADGDEYLPFDGQTNLLGFKDECGDEYFCSIDGEDFYNAKGEKMKGFFKKVGGGIVKAGKFVGKIAKKVGRAIVGASKKVVSGVKTAGGKVKAGAKKLIHHKTKDGAGKSIGESKRDKRIKEHKEKKDKRDKEISDAKAKGQTLPPPISNTPPPPTAEQKSPEMLDAQNQQQGTTQGGDIFTKQLPLADANTPKEKIVEVNGKQFDASGVPDGKEVVSTTDESGNSIAGVELQPNEVIAVTGKDGNIEYHTPDAASGGMSKGMKIGLIIGGSILVIGIIALVIYKTREGKK